MSVHSTAIVSATAEIAASATIGPFCVIEGDVVIGDDTVIESHARIGSSYGRVRIGARNLIQCGAVLGGPAQDYSYGQGAKTGLVIGNGNRIGEYVSISLGTNKGGGVTRVGDDNFIMAFAHLGHDCQIADHVIITNATQLAGHITVEHHALHATVLQAARQDRADARDVGATAAIDHQHPACGHRFDRLPLDVPGVAPRAIGVQVLAGRHIPERERRADHRRQVASTTVR